MNNRLFHRMLCRMGSLLLLMAGFLPAYGQSAGTQVPAVAVTDTAGTPADTARVLLITDVMTHAAVYQDSALTQLMYDKRTGRQRGEQTADGFRLQVYSSNRQQAAKNEALLLQQRLENKVDVPVYTLSEPPFWKVRLGNFRSREDANRYKQLFLHDFPNLQGSTYVVPDKIVLLQ